MSETTDAIDRLLEIAYRDEAKQVMVRADDLRLALEASGEPVAWAWHSDGMTGWALGHIKPTPENTHEFHERNTVVRPLYGDLE